MDFYWEGNANDSKFQLREVGADENSFILRRNPICAGGEFRWMGDASFFCLMKIRMN